MSGGNLKVFLSAVSNFDYSWMRSDEERHENGKVGKFDKDGNFKVTGEDLTYIKSQFQQF